MAGKMKGLFKNSPKTVAMVALGASSHDFLGHMMGHECDVEFDEVWSLNMGIGVFRHDVLWAMDDLRRLNKQFPAYGKLLMEHDKPIVTSVAYPEFPTSIAYPLEEVMEAVGDDYFRNTVAYTIAYAMVTGVKNLYIYGADYFYPGLQVTEEGAMNAAYYLGMSRHFGMKYHLPMTTTLLNCNLAKEDKDGNLHRILYGYEKQPWEAKDGSAKTGSSERPPIRENTEHQPNEVGANPAGDQDKGRPKRSAVVHSRRKSVRRARRGDNRSARVVLGGSQQNVTAGSPRMRSGIAIGPDGKVQTTEDQAGETDSNVEV